MRHRKKKQFKKTAFEFSKKISFDAFIISNKANQNIIITINVEHTEYCT